MNRVTLFGRLGSDVEIKEFENGGKVGNCTMATSSRFKKGEEWIEQTEWHNLKFVKVNDALKMIGKGCRILVQGEIRSREYEKDGEKRRITEIVVLNFSPVDWNEKGEEVAF